jgi:hypothetical protein
MKLDNKSVEESSGKKIKFKKDRNPHMLLAAALTALGVGYGACNLAYQRGTVEDLTCVTVERVENVIHGNNNSKYLVFTEGHGVLENTDSLFHWKFDSSDVHSMLARGGNYDMITYGWRMPVLSMYPNIISATPNDNCGE